MQSLPRTDRPVLATVLPAILLAAAISLLALGGDAGAAAKPKVGSSVTFKLEVVDDHILYSGHVRSARKACSAHRQMQMRVGGGGSLIASFKSKKNGNWRHTSLTDGFAEYRIVLLRKVTPRVICKRVARDFQVA